MITGRNGEDYLKTAHWYDFKRKYAYRYQPICYLCQKLNDPELCHIKEDRPYREKVTDVVYLCRRCKADLFSDTERGKQMRAWIDPVKRPAIRKLSKARVERLNQKNKRKARRA